MAGSGRAVVGAMDRQRFEWLVTKAVSSLPEEFKARLENIDVVVEDLPTFGQVAKAGQTLRAGATETHRPIFRVRVKW